MMEISFLFQLPSARPPRRSRVYFFLLQTDLLVEVDDTFFFLIPLQPDLLLEVNNTIFFTSLQPDLLVEVGKKILHRFDKTCRIIIFLTLKRFEDVIYRRLNTKKKLLIFFPKNKNSGPNG